MTLTFAQTLAEAPRVEKLKLWMRLQTPPLSFTSLAKPLNITSNTLARACAGKTMPVYQHTYLTRDKGVPAELLPRPMDRKTGPKTTRAEETAQAV